MANLIYDNFIQPDGGNKAFVDEETLVKEARDDAKQSLTPSKPIPNNLLSDKADQESRYKENITGDFMDTMASDKSSVMGSDILDEEVNKEQVNPNPTRVKQIKDNLDSELAYKPDPVIQELAQATGVDLEVQPYYNQDRARQLKNKQKAATIAGALRLLGQGVFGTKGMKIDKDAVDPVMARATAELSRMDQMYDADTRRTRDMNLQNKIQNARIEAGYAQQDKQQVNALKAQDKRYEQSNLEWDRRYGNQTDPEYLEQIEKMKLEYKKMYLQAATTQEKQRVNDKYEAMFDYQEKLYTEGIKTETGTNKTVQTIKGPDGKDINLTQMQVDDMANGFILKATELRKTNIDEFNKLPQAIQEIIYDGSPSANELKLIVKYLSGISDTDETKEKEYPTGEVPKWSKDAIKPTQPDEGSQTVAFQDGGVTLFIPVEQVEEFIKDRPNATRVSKDRPRI